MDNTIIIKYFSASNSIQIHFKRKVWEEDLTALRDISGLYNVSAINPYCIKAEVATRFVFDEVTGNIKKDTIYEIL